MLSTIWHLAMLPSRFLLLAFEQLDRPGNLYHDQTMIYLSLTLQSLMSSSLMPLNAVCMVGDAPIPFSFLSLPPSAADVFRLNSLPENESKQLDISASFFEIYSGKVMEDG